MADRETALILIDKKTGEQQEVVDFERLEARLAESEDASAAALAARLEDMRAALGEAQDFVLGDLLARLDRKAKWTQRFGDPSAGVQYEVSAPSPTAGTEGYDDLDLERELRGLVAEKVIDAEAAEKGLERTVTLTLRVPLDADLEQIAKALDSAREIRIAGVAVEPLKVAPSRSVKLPGITAMRKVPGTAEALDRAKRERPAPNRRAKVKIIRPQR